MELHNTKIHTYVLEGTLNDTGKKNGVLLGKVKMSLAGNTNMFQANRQL